MGIIVDDYSSKPGGNYADTVTFTTSVIDLFVDLSTLTGNYTAQYGEVLKGTLAGNYKISIADGATVTLDGVTINGTNNGSYKWAGITCLGNATIILTGTNTVKGFYYNYPGIFVPSGKTVTIRGDGSLTARTSVEYNKAGGGAGIGGGSSINCGNIVIEGGTITAMGAGGGAGIGGGRYGSCGSITITDGVTSVTATAGRAGNLAPDSIGKGNGGDVGTVTIGGTVGAISNSSYTYVPSH